MAEPKPAPEVGLIGAVTRTLNWIALATVVLYAALAVIVVLVFLNARHTSNDIKASVRQNETALAAGCIHRRRLGMSIDRTRQILRKTRGRKYVFAIPRKLIVLGLADDQREYDDDSILDCKE